MNKTQQRNLATSLTAFGFLVMAVTGVLMFFHLFDNYTKELHEIFGLAFVAIVVAHIFYNWNSMKSYFSKKVFLMSFVLVSAISAGFIANAPEGPNPKKTVIMAVFNAPISNAVDVLGIDILQATQRLHEAGMSADKNSIEELAKANNTSPFTIVSIITQDKK